MLSQSVGQAGGVGRQVDVAHITALINRASSGLPGGAILLEGEAGIGKTTVLTAAIRAAGDAGVAVIHASANVLDRARPFGPLRDAFGLDQATRLRLFPAALAAQAGALSDLLTEQPAGERVSPLQLVPTDRALVIERIAAMVETWSRSDPVLLAVDDLHWADPATLATLGQLHRLVDRQRLVIAATFRPAPQNPDLSALVANLCRSGAALRMLPPLAGEAVDELVEGMLGAVPGPGLVDCARRAAGNPFLVGELVGALQRAGRIEIREGIADVTAIVSVGAVTTEIRDAIIDRMANLGPDVGHLLQIGAAVGRSFSVRDLATMLGRPVVALLPLIRTAIASRLLEEDGESLRFRHDLVREAVESTIGPPALAALHLDIARTLAASGASAVRVAAHYALGAEPGDAAAVEWLRAAAAEIVARAPTSAAELLERALALTAVGDPTRDTIIAELVDAAFWGGDVDRAAELAGAALARPLAPRVAAGLHETMARALVVMGRPGDAVAHADKVVALGGEHLAWSLAQAAAFRVFALDLDGATADAQRAIALTEEHEDPWAETLASCVAAWEQNARGFHHRAIDLCDDAVRAADRSLNGEAHRLVPHVFRGLALESAGRTHEAQATLAHGQLLADQLGTTWATPFYHYALALLPWNQGRWSEVIAEIDAGLRYAREYDIGLAASWACAIGATAHLYRGDVAAAESLLDEGDRRLAAGGVQFGVDWLLRGHALLVETRGDRTGALALLRLGWEAAEGLKAAAALVMLGPDLVRLALEEGDEEFARAAAGALARGAVDETRLNVDAHALRCIGLVERDLGSLERARRIHDECNRPIEVVHDDEAIARTLLRLGQREAARDALDRCFAGCDRLGITLVPRRLGPTAAALGRTRRAGKAGVRAVTGWECLTKTERRVAELVAAGHTNPQVASELLVSRRTVESHLYRIFFKLDVTNRTQLALVVVGRGGPAD